MNCNKCESKRIAIFQGKHSPYFGADVCMDCGVIQNWEEIKDGLGIKRAGEIGADLGIEEPMTLGEQVRDAQRAVASWPDQKRDSVQLEGRGIGVKNYGGDIDDGFGFFGVYDK